MPVNTNVVNAKAVYDALADYLDTTIDGPKAAAITEEFIDDIGGAADNETKAGVFLQTLVEVIRGNGRSHVRTKARRDNDATVDAAVAAADSNI